MLGGAAPELAVTGRRLMALMLEAKLLRSERRHRERARAGPARACCDEADASASRRRSSSRSR